MVFVRHTIAVELGELPAVLKAAVGGRDGAQATKRGAQYLWRCSGFHYDYVKAYSQKGQLMEETKREVSINNQSSLAK